MKIESSDVKMSSHTQSSLEMSYQSYFSFKQEILGLADENSEDINQNNLEDLSSNSIKNTNDNFVNPHESAIRRVILELILQKFLCGGKKINLASLNLDESCSLPVQESQKLLIKNSATIERSVEYTKKDSVEFNTQAIIKTADKDITIDLDLSYTKEFYEKHSETINFEEVRFLDPLVIQYASSSTAFDSVSESMYFNFDINSDGTQLEIPRLKDGNGFLAWDRDSNGSIDNGSELFGPNTNDAFAELRAYDSDGNDWIDENDPIFDDLRIWTKNESGEDTLIALGQSGIGALYLNDMTTEFSYNKSVKEGIAQLKSSSIFLREDGTAGVLSSLNFIA